MTRIPLAPPRPRCQNRHLSRRLNLTEVQESRGHPLLEVRCLTVGMSEKRLAVTNSSVLGDLGATVVLFGELDASRQRGGLKTFKYGTDPYMRDSKSGRC